MRLSISVAACLLALPFVAACGSSKEPGPIVLARNMSRISGGQADTTDAAVVGIAIQVGQGFAMCSGSLIAPNLVLTARHCVAPLPGTAVNCGTSSFGTAYPANSFYVTTLSSIPYSANGYTPVSEVRVPSESADACGYDMALLVLAKSVPASTATPYIPRIDKEVVVGETYTAIGYGQTADSQNAPSGTRMLRSDLRVSWYNGDSLAAVCANTICGYGMASSEWQGETGVCSGDSGGPALDANNRVIGVVSRGSQGCQTPIYGEVAAWKDFIIQGALDAAQQGGYTAPAWALSGSTGPVGTGGAAGATGAGGAAGAGASGAAGAAGSGSGGPQGQSCDSAHSCPSGFECVYDSDPSQAYCGAKCTSASDCGSGLVCGDLKVCMNAPAAGNPGDSGSAGGCAVVYGRGPAKPVPWIIGLGLVVAATIRRRRR